MSLGHRIRQIRQQKGYSQAFVSTELGLSQGGYQKIETDQVKLKVDMLLSIAALLKVNVSELLIGSDKSAAHNLTSVEQSGESLIDLEKSNPAPFNLEYNLVKQLLESKEAHLLTQQKLIMRYEQELNQFRFGTSLPATDASSYTRTAKPLERKLTLLSSSPSFVISHCTEENYLYVEWKGSQTVQTVQQGGQEVLNLLLQKACDKILNDNRQLIGSWEEASQWVAIELFPRMVAGGLKRLAWIAPSHTCGLFSIVRTLQSSLQQITSASQVNRINIFNEFNQAKTWLLEDAN